jgi:glucose-1-phosphate cytidylyltransferase
VLGSQSFEFHDADVVLSNPDHRAEELSVRPCLHWLHGPESFLSGSRRVVKVVILAGGNGTRLSEETASRPKPMVEIGERPILWHIMKSYSHYGFSDFVVCLGYKGYMIKEYFSNYFLHMSDITFDMRDNSMVVHQNAAEPWRVTLVDTGPETQTGGRIKRVGEYIGDETFMLAYGDGVADVDIASLVAFHQGHGKLATITAVQPLGRFGSLEIEPDEAVGGVVAPGVRSFQEKPIGDGAWVNAGYFVLEPSVLDRIVGDDTLFESSPLEGLAKDGQLAAYRHRGFWQPMDALRDLRALQSLWDSGEAPWAVWMPR